MATHTVETIPEMETNGDAVPDKADSGSSPSPSVMENLLEPVEQGVVILDHSRRPIYANRCAKGILSASDEKEIAGIIDRSCPDSLFEKCISSGSAVTYVDVTLPDKETRKLLGLEVRSIGIPGENAAFYVLIHDFSRWKKLDELRSRFATSLSHRMRTPLTSIRNAVKILSEQPLEGEDREKLLDIGWRNVEKLISNLDELQKIFMIESEETKVCRVLTRARHDLNPVFEKLQNEGKLRGYKVGMPEVTVFTGRGSLRDFIVTAIEAYNTWLGEAPFIECSSSIKEELAYHGGVEKSLKIYLRPRTSGWLRSVREGLRDYLSFHEAHRGLVLSRLADALDAELEISSGNTISIKLPLEPSFDREKDLVSPLHMMIERADFTGSEFCLIDMRMAGADDGGLGVTSTLESVMCSVLTEEHVISKGEDGSSWAHFIVGKCPDDIENVMRSVHDKFQEACRRSGEQMIPSLRWEVRYSRVAGECIPESEILKI
jgi:hypothetical protein